MGDASQNIRWVVFQRTQEVTSELRVAIIRLVAIATFYAIHLYSFFSAAQPDVAHSLFHQQVSLICGIWCLVSIAIFIGVRSRTLPQWVKYLSTAADLLFLTAIALLDGGGNSYTVIVFPLIVAVCSLRFSNRLVWFATLMGIGCFLLLVGKTDQVWFDSNHQVPVVRTLITIACIAFSGIVGWQIVTAVRRQLTGSGFADSGPNAR